MSAVCSGVGRVEQAPQTPQNESGLQPSAELLRILKLPQSVKDTKPSGF
jgi:hypothetical protein